MSIEAYTSVERTYNGIDVISVLILICAIPENRSIRLTIYYTCNICVLYNYQYTIYRMFRIICYSKYLGKYGK